MTTVRPGRRRRRSEGWRVTQDALVPDQSVRASGTSLQSTTKTTRHQLPAHPLGEVSRFTWVTHADSTDDHLDKGVARATMRAQTQKRLWSMPVTTCTGRVTCRSTAPKVVGRTWRDPYQA